MDDTRLNNSQGQGQSSAPEGTGYSTPGRDSIVQSGSPAVPSPSETSEERLTAPRPAIQSLGETPGDANPALSETVAAEEGQGTTADLLRAREAAEEQYLRDAQAHVYQDQGPDTLDRQFSRTDSGQPEFPFAHQEDASARTMDSPDVQESFEGMSQGVGSLDLRARAERTIDRAGDQTAYTDAMAGQGPFGRKAEEYDAEGPEMQGSALPTDIDIVAPEMKNIPDEG